MTLAAFDTHKFVRTLKGAGFNEKQAEALTDAVRESQAFSEVATKSDLRELELRIEAKFANVDGELKFLNGYWALSLQALHPWCLKHFFRAFFTDFPYVASRSPYCAYCLRARSSGKSTEKCSRTCVKSCCARRAQCLTRCCARLPE